LSLGASFDVPFTYEAQGDLLCIGNMDAGLFARYRDEFLVDVREAYLENVDDLKQRN
jgi:hypothetical protein